MDLTNKHCYLLLSYILSSSAHLIWFSLIRGNYNLIKPIHFLNLRSFPIYRGKQYLLVHELLLADKKSLPMNCHFYFISSYSLRIQNIYFTFPSLLLVSFALDVENKCNIILVTVVARDSKNSSRTQPSGSSRTKFRLAKQEHCV